ncbi:MAG: MFS transporter, partial [Planctomycetota bacterium]
MTARPALPRVVFVLGAVSFCADLASEMIVPLLPALVASLGGGMLQLGLLQGLSDLAVAALKIVSGRWSDRQRRRKPWILGGYLLSALLRPLFAIVGTPAQAVLVRIGDRVGKGLRSA